MMNIPRRKPVQTTRTQSFLDNYLPILLQVASVSVPLFYSLYERNYGYESLSPSVRSRLQSDDLVVREEAVNALLNDLSTEKQNQKDELHYREHAAAAYDFGFFDVLYNEIFGARKGKQSDKFLSDALKCMRKMLKSEDAKEYIKRHEVLKKYGLKNFFQLCIDDHPFPGVTESALALLRTLTRFDRYRRWTIDDVPNGSQGCVLLQYIPEQDWRLFLESHLTTNDVNILKSATSIIAHASEHPRTALLLNKCDAIPQLIHHLRSVDKLVEVKSLIAISKIFESEPFSNWELLLYGKVMSDILRLATIPEKIFYQPPDEITEHSILLIIYTMAMTLLVKGTKQHRDEFTKLLVINQKQMSTIFMLSESTKQSSTKQLAQFNNLIDSPEWSTNHMALVRVRESARAELEEARYKYQQMLKKRRQQQMERMGMGMGGMGMMG